MIEVMGRPEQGLALFGEQAERGVRPLLFLDFLDQTFQLLGSGGTDSVLEEPESGFFHQAEGIFFRQGEQSLHPAEVEKGVHIEESFHQAVKAGRPSGPGRGVFGANHTPAPRGHFGGNR